MSEESAPPPTDWSESEESTPPSTEWSESEEPPNKWSGSEKYNPPLTKWSEVNTTLEVITTTTHKKTTTADWPEEPPTCTATSEWSEGKIRPPALSPTMSCTPPQCVASKSPRPR